MASRSGGTSPGEETISTSATQPSDPSGVVVEVIVYDRALSPDELDQLTGYGALRYMAWRRPKALTALLLARVPFVSRHLYRRAGRLLHAQHLERTVARMEADREPGKP